MCWIIQTNTTKWTITKVIEWTIDTGWYWFGLHSMIHKPSTSSIKCSTKFKIVSRMVGNNIILTFADLHTDILFHVCSFLYTNSICCLVKVCKSLKNKLYHPVIWRDTVMASSYVNEAIAESLKIRNIRTVMLSPEVNCAIPVRRSLVNMEATGTLENLIIQWRIPASHHSPCQCSDSSLLGLESLKCLVISLEGSTLESLLKRQLYRDLLSASNLRQLLILQQVFILQQVL